MTIESGLHKFAEYGHDMNLLALQSANEAGLLNDKGVAQYNEVKGIKYSQVHPELQKKVEGMITKDYLSILKEAMSVE
jgi:hypothetical protein